MGNSQSPSADPRFDSARRSFSRTELEDLKSLVASLAAQSQSDGRYISPSVFKSYIGIHGSLFDRLFDLITQKRNDQKLTFEDLVIAKGIYEKGTKDEIEDFIYQICDINGDGRLSRADLEAVLTEMLERIRNKSSSESGSDSHDEVSSIFLNAAIFSEEENSMTFDDFRKWCRSLPSVRKFLKSLLKPSDLGSEIPKLVYEENIDPKLIIMREEYAWHIGGALSQHELDEWKLLYHSSVHGLSFSTFLSNISNDRGQTLLIIKDKEGYIYGGYAPQVWERHGEFYGDMKSFLFQLYPKASIFRPTGANTNIQWCAVNFSSESIPNGVGFGGKVNHMGIFLSANFDRGHTFECTTFGSPCLSKTNRIIPDVIECWGIVHKGVISEKVNEKLKGTVLDRFKEDRNMLNMVGIANSSQ
jgi:Ca2+-binding EF-hand superfamily protein